MSPSKQNILRSVILLGGSSAVSLLVGLLTNKVYAIRVGPEGLGYWSLLLSLLNLGVLVSSLGISTGIIRMAANDSQIAQPPSRQLSIYRVAAWQVFVVVAIVTAIFFILFQRPIAEHFLAGAPPFATLIVMVAILLGIASSIQISTLNVQRQLRAVAQTNVISSLLGAVCGIWIVWLYGQTAFPLVIMLNQGIILIIASFQVYRLTPGVQKQNWLEVKSARLELLRFGWPYTISSLVGGGVQQILPLIILQRLGQTEVGLFRAVISLTNTYLGLMQSTLAQDYYVRISAANSPEQVARLIQQQSQVVMGIAVPTVLMVQGLGFLLLPLLFTPEFLPALDLLRWQVVGDTLKVFSWLLAFVVLAKFSPRVYFVNELISGVVLVGSMWLLSGSLGLIGVGLSNVIAYMVYISLVGFWVMRLTSFATLRYELAWWFLAGICVIGVGLLPTIWQPIISFGLALCWAWRFLWWRERVSA